MCENEFTVKDEDIICPQCGIRNSVCELLNNGVFDEDRFERDSSPQDYNPFDQMTSFCDRISIPFDCHCRKCGANIQVVLANRCFGFDVYDDKGRIVDSRATELIG